jgi:RES domain
LATALCANALNPLGFRHGLSRFSDPTGSAFGILYFGSSLKVAFVEVILRDRGEAHIDQIPIPYTELEAYICADIDVVEELNLVDLTGDAGLRMGVPTDVVGAKDQTLSRQWSKAFYEHPDRVDGIFYPSRFNEERNIALYDRARTKVRPAATPLLVQCRDELAALIRDLELAIV